MENSKIADFKVRLAKYPALSPGNSEIADLDSVFKVALAKFPPLPPPHQNFKK